MIKLLSGLNFKQQQAVQHYKGAMLVEAGAGSGKTRVLTRRIANLILRYHVSPSSIVALTFTNKATKEMNTRIHKLLHHLADHINISTFHSLGRSILRRESFQDKMRDYTPIDDNTRIELIREIIAKLKHISIHHIGLNTATNVLNDISMAKNNIETPHSSHQNHKMQPGELEYKIYDYYQKELISNHETDIDDDLMLPVILLRKFPSIRHYYQNLFQFINVDEYQDTNKAQYELIKLLDGQNHNLFAVGDVNQSIYGWRGANISNILNFKRDYPSAKVVHMKSNYRSTGNIIGVANSIIRYNHKGKPNYIANQAVHPMSSKVVKCTATTTKIQAEYVINQINKLHHKYHLDYNQFAVLFRKNKQAKLIEATLLKHHLHYQLISSNSFFNQDSVQDILGYLYVINDLHPSQSLKRIINKPKRGITLQNYQRLINFADSTKSRLAYVINNIYMVKGISKRGQHAILNFYQQILKWQKDCKNPQFSLTKIIYIILDDTKYLKKLKSQLRKATKLTDKAKIRANIDGIKGIIKIANTFDDNHSDKPIKNRVIGLAHFISVNSLPSSVTSINSKSRVCLMSVHASKGLEFPVVFIIRMNDGIFPDTRSKSPKQLHEERRIVYVAVTRAEKRLYLLNTTYAIVREKFKPSQESPFLKEVSPQYLYQIQVKSKNGRLITSPALR